jgi:lysyl-tRNA synthetase, class II
MDESSLAGPPPLADGTNPLVARRKKLEALLGLGIDPWGGRFDGRQRIADIRTRLSEVVLQTAAGASVPLPDLANPPEGFNFRQWKADQGGGELAGPTVRAAGRIVLHRDKGKLHFIDLKDSSGTIQIMVGQQQVGDDWPVVELLDMGDLIGVDGRLGVSNTGEISIFAERVHFLTKTLDPPPEKHHGLTDPELRQRMRYVDLVHTDGVMETFLARSKVVRSIRNTLADRDYVEVEGPTLHAIAGGAAARPFTTHHNALDIDLYLRIALELHLKRLLVGGMERVYELGRVYRNEGISPKHNPEFTMLELYEAYGDYNTMMELTEALIVSAIRESRPVSAGEVSLVLPWKDSTVDFTPPFARRTYDELFAERTGIDPTDQAGIARLAAEIGFVTEGRHPDVIKSDVFEARVEGALVGPIFVTDYPASICPLTKRKRDNQAVAERFELFVDGMEIANAYTELNDPDLQEKLFQTQLAGMNDEDSMAKMDHDFVRALRNGMPPAGGLGLGIDRLVMLLTNSPSIREVILFPLLRPEN